MTVRQTLADALAPHLPNHWRVLPWADSLDRIDTHRPVLMLYRERVTPSDVGTFTHLDNHMALWLLSPHVRPGTVDDDLDDNLDTLISALDQITWARWSEAERGTWGDEQYAGYKVAATITTSKE